MNELATSHPRVGILGAGQLGCMLAQSLQTLGAVVKMYDADPRAPGRERTSHFVCAAWTDREALERFVEACDVVTYEFENVETSALETIASVAERMHPSLHVLAIAQDRWREKAFLRSVGIPVVRSQQIDAGEDLEQALRSFGVPCVLKTARGGYDGKGQLMLRSESDITQAVEHFASHGRARVRLIAEAFVPNVREISCIVARAADGSTTTFPVAENLHRDHVLDVSVSPARFATELLERAVDIARRTAEALAVVGVLTVEFFVASDAGRDVLYVNELAPRPHNSGHLTRYGCTMSQFDALARVLLNIPLVPTAQRIQGAVCMGNLLGDVWLAQHRETLSLQAWRRHPNVVEVMLYAKDGVKARRKMGHYLVHAESSDQALEQARAFRESLMQEQLR